MKIGIDCRLWGTQHGGIGRYVEELVLNLQEIDSKNDYVVFCRKKDFDKIPQKRQWERVVVDIQHYTLKEQLVLPKIFLAEKLDLLHVPHFNVPIFYRRPFIVTIHDLLWHHQFGLKQTSKTALVYFLKYLGYRLVVRNAVLSAKKIIAPTNFVKKDLINRFGMEKDRVVVSYGAGITGNEKRDTGNEKREIISGVKRPYILYVGNFSPHKNLVRLLEAVKSLSKQDINLVVAGKKSSGFDSSLNKARELGIGSRVVFTGGVNDEELVFLYKGVQALVFPTLFEGFGMPGIEAMQVGTPVACSNIPVLREVYADSALYFNPHDAGDIAQKVLAVLEDKKLREKLISSGRCRAELYSWKKMASRVLQIYEEVC